jgi:hypothetical protein
MKYLKRFESHEEDYDDDDMMTDEEFKQDVLNQIMELRKTTNYWSTRDTLKNFTEWDFWSGSVMVSIDIEMADDIAMELYQYADSLEPGDTDLERIYDMIG